MSNDAIAVRDLSRRYASRDGDVVALARPWSVLEEKVEARDLLINELIDEINRFDAAPVAAEARAWKK